VVHLPLLRLWSRSFRACLFNESFHEKSQFWVPLSNYFSSLKVIKFHSPRTWLPLLKKTPNINNSNNPYKNFERIEEEGSYWTEIVFEGKEPKQNQNDDDNLDIPDKCQESNSASNSRLPVIDSDDEVVVEIDVNHSKKSRALRLARVGWGRIKSFRPRQILFFFFWLYVDQM
jgi:hypothetical protein